MLEGFGLSSGNALDISGPLHGAWGAGGGDRFKVGRLDDSKAHTGSRFCEPLAYGTTRDFRRVARALQTRTVGERSLDQVAGEQAHRDHTGWTDSGLDGQDGKYGFDGYLRQRTTHLGWG